MLIENMEWSIEGGIKMSRKKRIKRILHKIRNLLMKITSIIVGIIGLSKTQTSGNDTQQLIVGMTVIANIALWVGKIEVMKENAMIVVACLIMILTYLLEFTV